MERKNDHIHLVNAQTLPDGSILADKITAGNVPKAVKEMLAVLEHKELTAQLRRMSVETRSLVCLGCGYEHSCGIHGCAVLNAAARALENQEVSARWFDKGSLSSRCSNCGCKSTKESKYCPNCGARMEE